MHVSLSSKIDNLHSLGCYYHMYYRSVNKLLSHHNKARKLDSSLELCSISSITYTSFHRWIKTLHAWDIYNNMGQRLYSETWLSASTEKLVHPIGRCLATNMAWASYQIRKIVGCACTGNARNVFPTTTVRDPEMHHGMCVTHVLWCSPGLLTSGFLWSWRRGKRSQNYRRMRNPQFYASGERFIVMVTSSSNELLWFDNHGSPDNDNLAIVYYKRIRVFHNDKFHQLMPCQCREQRVIIQAGPAFLF